MFFTDLQNGGMRARVSPPLLTLAIAASLTTGVATADIAEERFRAVVKYWEWSSLLHPYGLDFPRARYNAGMTFSATVFASASPAPINWGFCSKGLGICQAYAAFPDGVVFEARAIYLGQGESELQALARFEGRQFESDDEQGNPSVPPSEANVRVMGADPSGNKIAQAAADAFLITGGVRIVLPVLSLPLPVRERRTDPRLLKILRDTSASEPPGKCVTRIPFAGLDYPQIPIVVDCPGSTGVQLLTRRFDFASGMAHWNGTAGGWMTNPDIVRRYRRLLDKHGSTIVSRQ